MELFQETGAESEDIRIGEADVMQVCLNGAIALLDGIKLRAEMLRAERQGSQRSGIISMTGSKTGAPLEVGDDGGLVCTQSQEQECRGHTSTVASNGAMPQHGAVDLSSQPFEKQPQRLLTIATGEKLFVEGRRQYGSMGIGGGRQQGIAAHVGIAQLQVRLAGRTEKRETDKGDGVAETCGDAGEDGIGVVLFVSTAQIDEVTHAETIDKLGIVTLREAIEAPCPDKKSRLHPPTISHDDAVETSDIAHTLQSHLVWMEVGPPGHIANDDSVGCSDAVVAA